MFLAVLSLPSVLTAMNNEMYKNLITIPNGILAGYEFGKTIFTPSSVCCVMDCNFLTTVDFTLCVVEWLA